MNKPKLWTREFVIDSTTNLFIYLSYYLLMVTIAVYAMDNLHASPSEAGLASGIFIVGALVSRILTGKFIERIGRKTTLYVGLIVFLVTTLLYFEVASLTALIVVRFLHGAGFGIAATATGTIIASIVPRERRGEGISYYAMSATMASAVGPFLGMFLNQRGSFSAILVLTAILLTASLIVVFFMRVPKVEWTLSQVEETKWFSLNTFFEPMAIPISIVSIFVGLSFSSILSFVNSYAREIQLSNSADFFFVVYAICILIMRPVTGILFDRKGEHFVMYPSFLLFALGLFVLGLAHQGFSLLLAGALVGLGYGTFLSSAQAIAVKMSPSHRMGLATSTYFSFIDGGVGVGPFLLGFMIPVTGLRGLYLYMSAVVIFSMVLYYFLHARKTKRGE